MGLHVVVLATFAIGYFLGGLDALERHADENRDGQPEVAAAGD